jgi:hypothetical protein
MRSSKPWLIVFAFLLVFAFSANSALATSYIKGYVRPSGDGINTCTPGGNCVQFINSGTVPIDLNTLGNQVSFAVDELNYSPDGSVLYDLDAIPLNLLGIQPGSVVTFVFAVNPVPDPSTSGFTFGILGCGGTLLGTNIGGIFDSSPGHITSNLITTTCTNVNDVSTLVGNGNGVGDKVSFTFNTGVTIPDQLAFSFPHGDLPSEIDVAAGSVPVSAPEPASLSMLAAGLVGLGVIRRKRTV